MVIVQDAFYIPDDIATGLATGVYRRFGGVVRYASGSKRGQIVKHLEPADLKKVNEAKGAGTKIVQFVKNNKRIMIWVLIFAGLVVAFFAVKWIYECWKKRVPKVLKEFRKSLKVYINAVREGTVNVRIIDDLMCALEALKNHKNYEKFNVQLTAEEFDVLVRRIHEYTIKLADDNDVELSQIDIHTNKGAILNLQEYLNAQKTVFAKSA